MNPLNKLFLYLLTLPSGLYQRSGVDVKQLRAIVGTKLMMDDRRPTTFQQTRLRKRKKPLSYATAGTMLLSGITGILFLVSFYIARDITSQLTIYLTLFFFMLSATLITDFTSVLIDVRDNQIILPKPVDDRTVVTARLLHIFIHICKIVIPMSIAGIIRMGEDYGWLGAVTLLVPIGLITLFSIFFINAIYLLILKVTTPSKFQAIISYVQIGLAIVMYASYQMVPRMSGMYDLRVFRTSDYPLIQAFPMYWMASILPVVMRAITDPYQYVFAFLGLAVPILSMGAVVKYLAPAFNSKLSMIQGSGGERQSSTLVVKRTRSWYSKWLSRVFTKKGAERMGFLFTWRMSSRSRDFKMRVYPTIGYLVVYLVVLFVRDEGSSMSQLRSSGDRGALMGLLAIYFSGILLTMSITQAVYSEQHKAAWIYFTAPINKPGEVILGSAKASIFRFFLPVFTIMTLVALWVAGPALLPNVLLGLSNEILIATTLVYVSKTSFPFSQPQTTKMRTGGFFRNLFVLFISGIIATAHYFIYGILPAVFLCLLMSMIAVWLVMGSIRNLSWNTIRKGYQPE